jgi:hypothetical protein
MNGPEEMHPRICERRKEVFQKRLDELPGVEPEVIVHHYEGKLPRPENYRRKTVTHLRRLLRKIDHYLELFEARRHKGEILTHQLSVMYGTHRQYIVKELARRMVKKA